MIRRVLPLVSLVAVMSCGGSGTPTQPTTPPAATRIIRLGGAMAFGNVQIGSPRTNVLAVYNDGTEALTFTGLTGTNGIVSVTRATPSSGTVPPGGNVPVTIEFTPPSAVSYSGSIGVTSNATSGTGTIAFSGSGTLDGLPEFSRSGSGDTVFDMPAHVARVRIIGTYNGNSSNFILRIAGRLIVNELVGTSWGQTRYDGTLLTGGGGVVAITNSSGVAWSVTEVR